MNQQDLLLTREEGVAVLTLNRPEKLNALSRNMLDTIPLILKEILEDDKVKVLVITGAGRGFCAGADVGRLTDRLSETFADKYPTRRAMFQPIGYWVDALVNLEKPTIAAVNGPAAGAGFSLTLACDIRIASEKAEFGATFVKRGLIPDGGATKLLPMIVGLSKAYELIYTGDMINAAEAERIGLVSRVVPHDKLMAVSMELATKIARGASVAIEFSKRAIRHGLSADIKSQLDFETRGQDLARQTEDHAEGVKSFGEKRPPAFKGR